MKTTELELSAPKPGELAVASPQGAPDSRPRPWGWIAAVLVVLLVGGAFLLQRQSKAKEVAAKPSAPPAVQVTLVTAKQGDIGVYVNGLGVVTPVYTVAVNSRVDGQLMQVNYHEGDMVKEGDALAEIDPGPYRAALTQAEGAYARDQALLENALVDLNRYKEALAKNAIPKQQYDTQVATVHQYQGIVTNDLGQIDAAKVNLAYCHITSPINGRVGLRLMDPGNIVHASNTNALAVITQLKPITVVFSVAEDYLPQIQKQLQQGNKLLVEAYDRAQQQKLCTGTVLTLDNQIDPTTGTVKIKALFDNDDGTLFPNQFVNARLLVDTQHGATLVPTQAIQRNAQGPFVYVVKSDQTVTMRPVTVGSSDTKLGVTAVEGLDSGETIAGDNFNRLQEGVPVTQRKAPAGGKQKQKGAS
jgi:membrane fusion protein, multidrug efflux system